MNATGTNTAHSTRPIATTGPDTSFIACCVASTRLIAVLEVMLHGFDHDDGVVDHDADGQHQAEHVSTFTLKPSTGNMMNAPSNDTGTVHIGMIVARKLCRKR